MPFDSELWSWGAAEPKPTTHLGRDCVLLASPLATVATELLDGTIEVELAVPPERGFHGVVWRLQDDESFESFFVRPHQVGNPDAIQYTPVFNGISSWQLYHGPGFWSPVAFPIDDWFRIRVVFAGARAEVYVGDLEEPALEIRELKRPVEPGRVGLFAGAPAIHLARFAVDKTAPTFRRPAPPPVARVDGIVPAWWISDAFEEALVGAPLLDRELVAARRWTQLTAEPSGLADLSRVNGVRDGRNTAFARTRIHSSRAQTKRLDFGFSDRAVVFLNAQALYRGDDGYRSRDYRFLGSIGYFDGLYLPLVEGDNDLVVAVSEDLGGWGVQARFDDAAGLTFE